MNVGVVRATGVGMSFQDGGRPGWRRFGIPASGFMDGHSARIANALVGNTSETTVLECTMHGAEIEFTSDTWIAISGACAAGVLPRNSARLMRAGEVLHLQSTTEGIWSYLAIPGGWQTEKYFGSTSSNPRAKLGAAIAEGSVLKSVRQNLNPFEASVSRRFPSPAAMISPLAPAEALPLHPGPQFSRFSADSQKRLTSQTWRISPQSDRTGFRLESTPLAPAPDITSEAVLPGSFQVPGNGLPIVTMPDGPTVGGYPKIAFMESESLWRLAQCPPGSQIRFRWQM